MKKNVLPSSHRIKIDIMIHQTVIPNEKKNVIIQPDDISDQNVENVIIQPDDNIYVIIQQDDNTECSWRIIL